MLVLTRKKNESVTVTVRGVTFNISIKEVRGNNIQLSFEAPPEVSILRTELLNKKEDQ